MAGLLRGAQARATDQRIDDLLFYGGALRAQATIRRLPREGKRNPYRE
jgi:hypothetical protein